MKIFKTKVFSRFAKREKINDSMLCEAVTRTEEGIIDANLGGNLIKQRVARQGQGRSKGYRVLIAIRLKKRYIFMDGFAKNEKDNIEADQLDALKIYGAALLNANDKSLESALKANLLIEVKYEKKT